MYKIQFYGYRHRVYSSGRDSGWSLTYLDVLANN